jgi:hypothetical protein
MKKIYEGINTPGYQQVRFTLDWRCGECESENVEIVMPRQHRLVFDGGPATQDEMQNWKCNDCGTETPGRQMYRVREMLDLTEDQKQAEREYLNSERVLQEK